MKVVLIVLGLVVLTVPAVWLSLSNAKRFAQAKRDRGEEPWGVFNPKWRDQRRQR